jgi:hypothetical protein
MMARMVLLFTSMLMFGIACGCHLTVWAFFFAVLLVFVVTLALAVAMGLPSVFTAFIAILSMQIGYFIAFLLRALSDALFQRGKGDRA